MTTTEARQIALRAARRHAAAELEVVLRDRAIEKLDLLNEEINIIVPHETNPELLELDADGTEVFRRGPEDVLIEWRQGAYVLKPSTREIVLGMVDQDGWLEETIQRITEEGLEAAE